MMRRLAIAAALAILSHPAVAQDRAPLLLRIAVSPQGPVWVGQRIDVTVTAMTPARFVSAPSWPDLVASQGRIIVLPEVSTVPGTERVEGASYAALQRTYSVFAAEAGTLVLAPVAMSARVGGADGQPVDAQASTAENRITARLPPGVSDVARLVVAPGFRMTASVEGDTQQIHVGQALVRTLRMEADDTAAMLLPVGAWGQPEGVRVYPDPPVLQDHSDRGVFHALRVERVAFVPQRPGSVELPGFAVTWFDPRSRRAREVAVEPLRLEVLPAAAAGEAGGADAWPAPWLLGAGLAASALFGGGVWWWRRKPHRRRAAPMAPFAAACRAGDAAVALRALYRWCDAVLPPGGERTIGALARLSGVPDLAEQAAALEQAVLGGTASGWNGKALLVAARSAERALRHAAPGTRGGTLPPLNPMGGARVAPRLTQPRWAR